MHHMRERWLALFGGILLVTLTVSTAFGARPEGVDNRGQSVSSFVHSLVFGDPAETDEDSDETPSETETEGSEESEELTDESDVESDVESVEADGAAHGVCVSEVAQDATAIGGDNENHGGAVSEAARETCWPDATEGDEELVEEVEELDPEVVDPEAANFHGKCVSIVARDKAAVGGDNENHGGAVSEAARDTCWPDATEGEEVEETEATAADEDAKPGKRGGSSKADAHRPNRGQSAMTHGKGHGRGGRR